MQLLPTDPYEFGTSSSFNISLCVLGLQLLVINHITDVSDTSTRRGSISVAFACKVKY